MKIPLKMIFIILKNVYINFLKQKIFPGTYTYQKIILT